MKTRTALKGAAVHLAMLLVEDIYIWTGWFKKLKERLQRTNDGFVLDAIEEKAERQRAKRKPGFYAARWKPDGPWTVLMHRYDGEGESVHEWGEYICGLDLLEEVTPTDGEVTVPAGRYELKQRLFEKLLDKVEELRR